MSLKVSASPTFVRTAKKLHAKDKKALDQAVNDVAGNPALGEEKRGDLMGVFVYKFKLNKQETLLAYELSPNKLTPDEVVLLGVGPHENFYVQLKR
ncbi:MAG: type II toxin-antitoxin system RelE/ParE family toxin [Rhodoferax sp.]|jgi:mRNA-degrading endonuclease RelE of RelBE toxin-antitoxin system|uniref:type II toxin-antitoxin system RelE/ParE family toxin n=1 Tax=Rhodoferax sp. TaxID=50421 RepID=UPI003BB18B69